MYKSIIPLNFPDGQSTIAPEIYFLLKYHNTPMIQTAIPPCTLEISFIFILLIKIPQIINH